MATSRTSAGNPFSKSYSIKFLKSDAGPVLGPAPPSGASQSDTAGLPERKTGFGSGLATAQKADLCRRSLSSAARPPAAGCILPKILSVDHGHWPIGGFEVVDEPGIKPDLTRLTVPGSVLLECRAVGVSVAAARTAEMMGY